MNRSENNVKKSFLGGKRVLLVEFTLTVLILFSACAGKQPVRAIDPASTIVPKSLYSKKPPRVGGAIWPGDTEDNMFFSDAKASRVGDIVTITVEETASSNFTATTDTSRESSVNFGTGPVLGLPGNLGIQNFLGMGNGFNPSIDANTAKSHSGDGETTRGGQLTATITAKIIEVLPRRRFKIEGRRAISVNNEEQIMVLTGLVRYQDIGFNNIVSSTFIADAGITYSGQGVVADGQRVGWLSRMIATIWPF